MRSCHTWPLSSSPAPPLSPALGSPRDTSHPLRFLRLRSPGLRAPSRAVPKFRQSLLCPSEVAQTPALCPGPAPFSPRTGWQAPHRETLWVPLVPLGLTRKRRHCPQTLRAVPSAGLNSGPSPHPGHSCPCPARTLAKGLTSCFPLGQAPTVKRNPGEGTAS